MANLKVIAKWDIDKNNWIKYPQYSEYGKSFSVVEYDDITNSNKKINYIILNPGYRVENLFRTYKNVSERKAGGSTVLNHYSNFDGNYSVKLILVDADAPLVEQAKLLAKYIDRLSILPTTNSINLVGLSKGSVMDFYVPKFLKVLESFQKVNVFNVAAPYCGTKLASPLIFYPEVREFVISKFGDNKLSELVYKSLIDLYELYSSNSHMDYDISLPGGIPEDKKTYYDKSLIENVFCEENIDAIKHVNCFKNIITGIDDNTLKEAIKTLNINGIGLCILNEVFFENKSDGMVYIDTQRKVEDVLDIKSYQLRSAHHDVNGNPRVFNDVLNIVDDTIEEYDDKRKKLTII